MNKQELTTVNNDLRNQKQAANRDVADLDKQIDELLMAKAKRERDAFVLSVKEKAVRAAVRVLEDHDII